MSATNTISIKDQNKKAGLTAKGDQRQFVQHSYTDRSNDILDNLTASDENIIRLYREDSVGGPFPIKLQIVLKVTEQLGQQHIISWLPHGRSFMIHRPREFEEEIMGKFFKQTKLTSFRRQLNLYDFQRITHGRDAGSYYHELFLRGKPLLVKKMVRRKVKGTKIRASSSPDDEPNFYAMPYMSPVSHNHGNKPKLPNSVTSGAMLNHNRPNATGAQSTIDSVSSGSDRVESMGGQTNPDVAAGHLAALSQFHQGQLGGLSQLEQSLRGSIFDTVQQSANLNNIRNNSLQYQQALNALQGNPMLQQASAYGDLAQHNQMLSHNSAIDNVLRYSNALNNASGPYQQGNAYNLFNHDALRGLSTVASATGAFLPADYMLSQYNKSMPSLSQFSGLPGGMNYSNVPGSLSTMFTSNPSLGGVSSAAAMNHLLGQANANVDNNSAQVASTLIGLKEQNL
mmetsp:Transcript_1942/g.2177  ORF Transcript_1942/g.2177 Transcript_1942/m.2177 type:complete len:455 (+) Transcript_1942:275-1639(+)